jgi:hypothetical protein
VNILQESILKLRTYPVVRTSIIDPTVEEDKEFSKDLGLRTAELPVLNGRASITQGIEAEGLTSLATSRERASFTRSLKAASSRLRANSSTTQDLNGLRSTSSNSHDFLSEAIDVLRKPSRASLDISVFPSRTGSIESAKNMEGKEKGKEEGEEEKVLHKPSRASLYMDGKVLASRTASMVSAVIMESSREAQEEVEDEEELRELDTNNELSRQSSLFNSG